MKSSRGRARCRLPGNFAARAGFGCHRHRGSRSAAFLNGNAAYDSDPPSQSCTCSLEPFTRPSGNLCRGAYRARVRLCPPTACVSRNCICPHARLLKTLKRRFGTQRTPQELLCIPLLQNGRGFVRRQITGKGKSRSVLRRHSVLHTIERTISSVIISPS